MMDERFSRTELIFGADATKKLASCRVAVFGVGGVGGYVVEALARSGVGTIDIIDNDTVALTNINRQIIALSSTVGRDKVDVMRERVLDINQSAKVNAHKAFFLPETADNFDFSLYDYVVDAIDTVKGKIELAVRCDACGTPIISAMGAGNKTDPTKFEVADINKTSVCPLARVMRTELRRRSVKKLKVVYSKEIPITPAESDEDIPNGSSRRSIPGSLAFVPSVMGLIIAGEVIIDLIKWEK